MSGTSRGLSSEMEATKRARRQEKGSAFPNRLSSQIRLGKPSGSLTEERQGGFARVTRLGFELCSMFTQRRDRVTESFAPVDLPRVFERPYKAARRARRSSL